MKRINVLLLVFSLLTIGLLSESCTEDESCPTIECNTGTLNEETCNCDCPSGFSGTNCETEDLCVTQNVVCENGGTCEDGNCDCPDGYTGINCEDFDPSQVQFLLEGGKTPKELFDGGIILDNLYGKMYQGGIIFYLNTTDGTGMVAAPQNQSDAAQWGCTVTDISNLMNITECPGMGDCTQPVPEDTFEGTRIGDGAANTDAILDECATDVIAAKLCRDYRGGNHEDWFLPSRGELNLMYANLQLNGHGMFADALYWSSTEANLSNAWSQHFAFGYQLSGFKGNDIPVRAARAF